MQEYYNEIGEAAGKIYQTLERNGALENSRLQREAKISETALFQQGIGWLAREGKLEFQKKGNGWQIALGDCCQAAQK